MNQDTILDQADHAEYAVYQQFSQVEELKEMAELFSQHQIPFRSHQRQLGGSLGSSIIGSSLQPDYWIEIPTTFFVQANRLLEQEATEHLQTADLSEHPFSTYTDEELIEVLSEADAWNPEAVLVARILLKNRGVAIDEGSIKQAIKEKYQATFSPKSGNTISLIGLGFLGLFSGIMVWFLRIMLSLGGLAYYYLGKKRNRKGNAYYEFDAATRNTSKWLMLIVSICVLLGMANLLYFQFVIFPDFDYSLSPW